jgi:hypothetical protein
MRINALIFVLVFTGTVQAAEHRAPRDPESYSREYTRDTIGPKAIGGAALHAGIGQAMNHPPEWGQGAAGFGRRFASGFAGHAVKTSIEFPIAAIRHEDLHYHRSTEQGFGPRLGHALVSTVITEKTTTGQKTVASGRIAGSIGSGLISRAWQPAMYRTVAGGFATGGISLGTDAAVHVVQEFWPRSGNTKRAPLPPDSK